MDTANKVCEVLIEAGVNYVFGMPGGKTIPIWNALYNYKQEINPILCRHEQAASCMADVHGRLTGKPSVLMGQGAFIASSGAFGVLEAYLSNSPLVAIVDTSDGEVFGHHGNYQSGSGEYGSFDIRGIFKSMTKFTTYAATPEEVIRGLQLAIKHAITGRPGPTCVIMRNQGVTGKINEGGLLKIHPTSGYLSGSATIPPTAEMERAITLIKLAERPLLIAGNGIHLSKAHQQLQALAEKLGAPVATSYKGKSAIAETHPLAVGIMGRYGQKIANEEIPKADVLIVAGCHLSPSDTANHSPALIDPSRQKIIQIDIDPRNAGWTFPIEMALIGDLKAVLEHINAAIPFKKTTSDRVTKALSNRKLKGDYFDAPEVHSDAVPLLPQRIVKEIEEAVDASTLITLDAGNNRLWMSEFFKSKSSGSFFCPGGIAGMGWSAPAALGAKMIHPDRPVLSVSGDGGFAMMSHVLSTAVQYKVPVVWVVMNNSVLGMVRDIQGERQIATRFTPTDFAQIAQAFGARGVTVNKPGDIRTAIDEGFASKEPTVIDIITSGTESFQKIVKKLD